MAVTDLKWLPEAEPAAVYYGPRRSVVVKLLRLMKRVLTARERAILLAFCGFYEGGPLVGRELARRFPPVDGVPADRALREAIATVRRAIPESSLRICVRRIPSEWQEYREQDTAGKVLHPD